MIGEKIEALERVMGLAWKEHMERVLGKNVTVNTQYITDYVATNITENFHSSENKIVPVSGFCSEIHGRRRTIFDKAREALDAFGVRISYGEQFDEWKEVGHYMSYLGVLQLSYTGSIDDYFRQKVGGTDTERTLQSIFRRSIGEVPRVTPEALGMDTHMQMLTDKSRITLQPMAYEFHISYGSHIGARVEHKVRVQHETWADQNHWRTVARPLGIWSTPRKSSYRMPRGQQYLELDV